MSEFSESYHLFSSRSEDACELLRRSGLKGYIFPPVSGWTSFVAEGGEFEPDQKIVSAASLPLLHFVSAEDHGWSFALFENGQITSAYRCDWDDEVTFDDSRYSRPALEPFIPAGQKDAFGEFEQKLRLTDIDQVIDDEPASLFAQALGLPRYGWFSYHYVAQDIQEFPDEHKEVIRIP